MVRCAICGKELSGYTYDFGQYVYKKGNKYFCGWEHMREFERGHTKQPPKMEWRTAEGENIKARGYWGEFTIKLELGEFRAEYRGFDNTRRNLGLFISIEDAKIKCECNCNWEK